MSDLAKKKKEVLAKFDGKLTNIMRGEEYIQNIDGMYLTTDALYMHYRELHPNAKAPTPSHDVTPLGDGIVIYTFTWTFYDENGEECGTYNDAKVINFYDTEQASADIKKVKLNALYSGLRDQADALDFGVLAQQIQRKNALDEIKKEAEKKVAQKGEALSAGETFDALIKMTAINKAVENIEAQAPEVAMTMVAEETDKKAEEPKPEKPKAKKTRKKASKKAEKEETDDSFDPFAAEGVTPPTENPQVAQEEPEIAEVIAQEETPEVQESTTEPEETPLPEENTEESTAYVITEGDFANARYASKYAGKTLSDVSKEELKAVLSFGDKAIKPAFAKVIEDYLKG